MKSRGFTLVEVAVAVAILGLAFTTLLGLHTKMLDVYTSEHNRLRASLCARYLMTDIETAFGAPEVETRQGLLRDALEDAGYFDDDALDDTREATQGWNYEMTVSSQDLPLVQDALRRVDMTISWGEADDENFNLVYFVNSNKGLANTGTGRPQTPGGPS